MSHSITLAFGPDLAASSVSVPFLAPEHPPRSVKEDASLGASSRPVYSPESNAMQRDDANPSRSPTSGSPTSVAPSRATAEGTSTTLGAHSSNTPLRRPIKAYFVYRTLFLEGLRTQELSAGLTRQVSGLSDRPTGTGDTALATTNTALTEAEKAWRALPAEERELYRQPEEAREMHLARLAQEHPEIQ
ncbi:hypothetical protein K523DRAFT_419099 [Schizophyllum commune Tattone D]|nr:hypothetical protein K525DRAFT_250183 [Schizophyllum commune Loenen D]KAI5826615.1 hypothetical protein K523DRAFT_419099 [Schizophyllum commune Tattone D]